MRAILEAIGGAVEKAQAAKEGGKTLFLIPEENSELVAYELVERKIGGFTNCRKAAASCRC